MKKMPTLFVKLFDSNGKVIFPVTRDVTQGCEWVLNGEGIATRKWDGTCCMVKDGELYARFDYKVGRSLPDGAIPCQDKPDEHTGHFPHWVKVTSDNANYKWHWTAFQKDPLLENGTYELCGQHFQNNIDKACESGDVLIRHGEDILNVERTYDGIKNFLFENVIEGIVFHRENGDMCKIKRSDFCIPWGNKKQ